MYVLNDLTYRLFAEEIWEMLEERDYECLVNRNLVLFVSITE